MSKEMDITIEKMLAEYERIKIESGEKLYKRAVVFVIENQSSSISKLATGLGIGNHKAHKLICQMETDGIVSKHLEGRSRAVLFRKKKGL